MRRESGCGVREWSDACVGREGIEDSGFRNEQIRKVQSDEHFRIDVTALVDTVERDRQAGLVSFLVVATRRAQGVWDPMDEIADFVRTQNMWMHVDAAYGASVALSKSRRSRS